MARKTVATKRATGICIVQDDLGEVRDGLTRIDAIVELFQLVDENEEIPPETVRGAVEAMRFEAVRLRLCVRKCITNLDDMKKLIAAKEAPQLEVVNG